MDLIILALIAVILVVKLRNQLGNVDKNERDEEIIKRFLNNKSCCCTTATTADKKKDITEVREIYPVKEDKASNPNPETENYADYILGDASHNPTATLESLKETFKAQNFTVKGFVDASKKVYEMLIESYAQGDLTALQELVSPEVYKLLSQKITSRQKSQSKLHNSIIGIKAAKIYQANLDGNTANIHVTFISEQINFVEDQNANIIKGNKNEITSLADYWIFSKQTTSTDKVWIVSEINDAAPGDVVKGVMQIMQPSTDKKSTTDPDAKATHTDANIKNATKPANNKSQTIHDDAPHAKSTTKSTTKPKTTNKTTKTATANQATKASRNTKTTKK